MLSKHCLFEGKRLSRLVDESLFYDCGFIQDIINSTKQRQHISDKDWNGRVIVALRIQWSLRCLWTALCKLPWQNIKSVNLNRSYAINPTMTGYGECRLRDQRYNQRRSQAHRRQYFRNNNNTNKQIHAWSRQKSQIEALLDSSVEGLAGKIYKHGHTKKWRTKYYIMFKRNISGERTKLPCYKIKFTIALIEETWKTNKNNERHFNRPLKQHNQQFNIK